MLCSLDDPERLARLVEVDGKMKVGAGGLLPPNDGTPPAANAGGTSSDLFLAGDVRANENPVLTALHTVFVRLHNLRVDQLVAQGETGVLTMVSTNPLGRGIG